MAAAYTLLLHDPLSPAVRERYFNLFHLNPPTWSLFWEYIANIFYALILVRLPKKVLWVLTALAAVALAYESYRSHHLSVGWGGDNIRGGGIRVSFSFLAGMLVYRSRWISKVKAGFCFNKPIIITGVFVSVFNETFSWFADPLVVIFYFPLLIMMGAGALTRRSYTGCLPVFRKDLLPALHGALSFYMDILQLC